MVMPATLDPLPEPGTLEMRRIPFSDIPRAAWDQLFDLTPAATPFSRWTFHRAWWDAYGGTAQERYLVLTTAGHLDIRGIVPLMERSGDMVDAPVPEPPLTVYMAASYRADYSTILARPTDLPDVARMVADDLAGPSGSGTRPADWDVVDLRRLRADDAALHHLRDALDRRSDDAGWTVLLEEEDVCPVITLGTDWETYLAGLGKKARHEIRRKLRRAHGAGGISLRHLPLDAHSVDRFIELHQARWGAVGLFPPTEGGDRSRCFLHRLVELESHEGSAGAMHIGEVQVGDRVVYMYVGFVSGRTCYFYNAGMDPAASDLSPGVVGMAAYLQERIRAGTIHFDLLRGDEPYKYEWGAVDQPICRLVVERRTQMPPACA